MKKQSLSRAYILALFAVFFAPLLFAMWLYFGPNSWLTLDTQNHGVLIQPPRPLNEFVITGLDASIWTQEQFLGKWTLLYLGNENCDLYCEASLFKMRQVRLSLGRDSQRIQRKYLGLGSQATTQDISKIFEKYPDMIVTWFDRSQFHIHLSQFKDLDEHVIYLIDPLGNLMMCYSKHATAKGIKKDLTRLLKVSKIG